MPRRVVWDHYGSPEGWVDALIQREGGLPKAGAPLTHYSDPSNPGIGFVVRKTTGRPEVFPVAHWEIERISLTTPYNFLTALLKQEAVYSIQLDVRVEYADGDAAVLRWDTWRYGTKFGPVALDGGGGPVGDLEVLVSPAKVVK